MVVVKTPNLDPTRPYLELRARLAKVFETFTSERQSWESLSGLDCVAQILDIGIRAWKDGTLTFDCPFIVQQYIDGTDLSSFATSGPLKAAATWARYASSLATALSQVHSRGVVHGDIWPRNILLRRGSSDEQPDPVLIDFGQALLIDLAFHQPGSDRYKHPYCAPERRAPDRRWGYGADIYSLGGVLFFLATGQPPWTDPISDVDEIQERVIDALRQHNPTLFEQNEGVAHIIGRCLRETDAPQPRTLSPESLQQDIDLFFPPAYDLTQALQTSHAVQETLRSFSSSQPLFGGIAGVQLAKLQRELQDMSRGLFQIAGDHERIVSSLSQVLSVLGPDDKYLAVSVPSFWYPWNLGIRGRFHTMNRMIARRGVIIQRIFVITEKDAGDKHFSRVMEAQQASYTELHERARFYTGWVRRSEAERQVMVNKGHHFGLWVKGDQSLMVVPYYTSREGPITGVRFWSCPPGNAKEQTGVFQELLSESKPISEWTSG